MKMSFFEIDRLSVSYGDMKVLRQISFDTKGGEILCIVGSNGAGKTTLLRTISGALRPDEGKVSFMNERIDKLPCHKIVSMGLTLVPEGRMLFQTMTVLENLELGSYLPEPKKNRKRNLEKIFGIFPILRLRQEQQAGTLSGGEQQMLALGRGLMTMPKLMMLDEPSLGLGPLIVKNIFSTFHELIREGITVLLVEQNVRLSLSISDRACVVENGEIILEGKGVDLLNNGHVRKSYLGI
jgi:branched-chain amino acid transport system ATP-binding protein